MQGFEQGVVDMNSESQLVKLCKRALGNVSDIESCLPAAPVGTFKKDSRAGKHQRLISVTAYCHAHLMEMEMLLKEGL